MESGGSFGGRIQVYGEVSTVFEKLDAGQRWAQKDVEMLPVTRGSQMTAAKRTCPPAFA